MNLPVLYKRSKTSAIVSWEISAEHEDNFSTIIKLAGQLNGKLTPHTETIEQGKNLGKANATTPAQQADSQAQSDWAKKRDEGYKSLEDLKVYSVQGRPGLYASDKGIQSLEQTLELILPKFNTTVSGAVKPMLAKAVNWDKVKYPCYVQPKLDGVRTLMVVSIDEEETKITFLSRSGKEYTTLGHIRQDVLRYVFDNNIKEGFILDGEIYCHNDENGLSFQQICAAVKKQSPDSLKLQFRCYDIVNDKLQDTRIQEVALFVSEIGSPYIQAVDHYIVHQKEDVINHHDEWVKQGYEGAMIRLSDGTYDQGQRSSSLLKVKQFDDSEFEFLGWETGQREEDLIAVCKNDSNDLQFRAKIVGSRADKEQSRKVRVGRAVEPIYITIKYFGRTELGLPRFPIAKSFKSE